GKGLHCATVGLQPASFPFLSRLKLRTAINLSRVPVHDKAAAFFENMGVEMLIPCSEVFDGPYDIWEEGVKEALEVVLEGSNHPMIILDRSNFEKFVTSKNMEPETRHESGWGGSDIA
ncbi:unnamed protein product, partial [Choristocarpus tenellus]